MFELQGGVKVRLLGSRFLLGFRFFFCGAAGSGSDSGTVSDLKTGGWGPDSNSRELNAARAAGTVDSRLGIGVILTRELARDPL